MQKTDEKYVFTGDYKAKLIKEVDKLVGDRITDREERMQAIDELLECYVSQTGERPDGYQLDRLGSLILYEDLEGDTRPDKMTIEEAPIMTGSQIGRRHRDEVSDTAFAFIGNDGTNHREPTRRRMTTGELMAMDTESRRKKDEKPSKVIVTGGVK
jgi:hypothetical protein